MFQRSENLGENQKLCCSWSTVFVAYKSHEEIGQVNDKKQTSRHISDLESYEQKYIGSIERKSIRFFADQRENTISTCNQRAAFSHSC